LTQACSAEPGAVRDVLRYFLRHPGAADSLQGVAGWRLLDEVVRRRVGETQAALDWLVAQGFLRAVSTAATGPIFSLNPDRRALAEEFLSEELATPATPPLGDAT
jgi:hypothetical protein